MPSLVSRSTSTTGWVVMIPEAVSVGRSGRSRSPRARTNRTVAIHPSCFNRFALRAGNRENSVAALSEPRSTGAMDGYEPVMSFDAATAAEYDRWPRGDEDAAVAFLTDLAGSGPALELAIGTGRIAVPL